MEGYINMNFHLQQIKVPNSRVMYKFISKNIIYKYET